MASAASREQVYIRAFVRDVRDASGKKRKVEFGNPPFAFQRVRVCGLVVDVRHDDESDRTEGGEKVPTAWLWVDDATGVARVRCRGAARLRALPLVKGSSVEVYGSMHPSEGDVVVADSVRDNSSEPFADLLCMLETMDAYQTYFGVAAAGAMEPGSLADLSPIRPKQQLDGAAVVALITPSGVSLASLAAAASGGNEQALLPVLHNLMESGLCYCNKEKYFPL